MIFANFLIFAVAFLASTIPGATREPDTESDEEDEWVDF